LYGIGGLISFGCLPYNNPHFKKRIKVLSLSLSFVLFVSKHSTKNARMEFFLIVSKTWTTGMTFSLGRKEFVVWNKRLFYIIIDIE
jgi:hypothetical protein